MARRPHHDIAQSGCPYIHGVLDVLYDTYNTFCTIHIRNIGRYEWASVVCRKAQVVQSLPHHAEYGRSGAEREFLRSV